MDGDHCGMTLESLESFSLPGLPFVFFLLCSDLQLTPRERERACELVYREGTAKQEEEKAMAILGEGSRPPRVGEPGGSFKKKGTGEVGAGSRCRATVSRAHRYGRGLSDPQVLPPGVREDRGACCPSEDSPLLV